MADLTVVHLVQLKSGLPVYSFLLGPMVLRQEFLKFPRDGLLSQIMLFINT